ncbi:unnamed protein product [Notodromas monacha]|uniref:Cadherin domain-containing protein n=1 Tax=Notodromas monacha TaxID=399045 RepID=A0A7R9BUS9_9CRUS|nr:unnamed protein product [Notodromas monacha]CAG0922117.1 unnamed protein product [Notodromas monacha]
MTTRRFSGSLSTSEQFKKIRKEDTLFWLLLRMMQMLIGLFITPLMLALLKRTELKRHARCLLPAPPRSTIVTVMLQVLDENDNNPVFRGAVTNVTVSEDIQPGSQIMVLEAVDADEGENGRITYLLDRQSAEGKFRIDPVSGAITVSGRLDREVKNFYTLVVEAWDNFQLGYSTGESRNTFKQIGVEVLDVNDEPPIFVQPSPNSRSGDGTSEACSTITEFHPPGDTVGLVSVRDADDISTPNGWVTFSIEAGDEEGFFHVENTDFQSGRVLTTRPLVGRFGNYNLTIRATDRGFPPLYTSTVMEICVLDFNDHEPVFLSPPNNSTFRIPENATVGTVVAKVTATDNDIGRNGQVRFGLRRDPVNHWKAFAIDPISGFITLTQPLDRERQKFYQLRVEARDMGLPTALSSDLDLSVYVKNVDDMKPRFTPNKQRMNFTEHMPPGKERRLVIEAVDEDDDDFDYDETEDQRILCYFIVGGNQGGFFTIDPTSRTVMAIKELDREERDVHTLIIRATDSCSVPPGNISFYDQTDPSLLNVTVFVNDINDNAPRFIKRIFTGGVSTDADFGLEFLELTAVDPDYGQNAELTFAIVPPIRETLSEGLESLRGPPFLVDEKNGVLQLNFDPQPGMKGYFDFEVTVNDTGGLWDKSRVFIYLLREDQRVRFLLRLTPGELRGRLEVFQEALSNVTSSIVNVDEIRVHEGRGGLVDRTKTDLYVHLVNRTDHSILPVDRVLNLIDSNVERLDQLFKDYNVIDSAASKPQAVLEAGPGEQLLVVYLGGATVILAVLLALVIGLCLHQRTRFKRQLKAATATAFGSNDSGLNRPTPHQVVPNTNVHSVEGSNPVWMTSYDNDWYKSHTEEDTSQRHVTYPQGGAGGGEDSLDDNAVLAVMEEMSTIYNPEPYHDGAFSSKGRSSMTSKGTFGTSQGGYSIAGTTSNNLNTSHTYKQNIYAAFEKMHNPLLAHKYSDEPTTDL